MRDECFKFNRSSGMFVEQKEVVKHAYHHTHHIKLRGMLIQICH